MTDGSELDADMLERLRRGVPLVLTPTGRFRFDGEDVTHQRVQDALRAGLDVTEAGEPTVRLGNQWCYLTVHDCPLRATSVQERGGGLWLRLDDGRSIPLAFETLWEEPGAGLRASAPSQHSGRPLAVRLTNAASMELSAWIELEGDTPVLCHGNTRYEVPSSRP